MSDAVALIPAAGFARRLGPLTGSKEVAPVRGPDGSASKPLAGFLLERLAAAGIREALVVVREDKRDVPARLGDGDRDGLAIDYVLTAPLRSVVETLDAAYPRVAGRRVVLGFPDIVFRPADAFAPLLAAHRRTGADVTLGLFPRDEPERSDMVELGAGGAVERVRVKEPDRGLRYTWSIAAWSAAFGEFLHGFARASAARGGVERHVGHAVQAAIEDGLPVDAVAFEEGSTIDLGTPGRLAAPPAWVVEEVGRARG